MGTIILGISTLSATSFATSRALPPPTPTSTSHSCSRTASARASTFSRQHSPEKAVSSYRHPFKSSTPFSTPATMSKMPPSMMKSKRLPYLFA